MSYTKQVGMFVGAVVLAFVLSGVSTLQHARIAEANGCTPTGFFRDSINMTAKSINPGNVSGEVDATGCNIGVYFDNGSSVVKNSDVHGANYFGILVNGDVNSVAVDVINSSVHQIGESPFNGAQHGVGIYYRALGVGSATGNVRGNEVYDYQKGGIVTSGSGAVVNISDNEITGLANVPFIAQNGIQVSYGATGQVMRNVVNGNWYTGASWASTGILVFQSSSVQVGSNTLSGNQTGIAIETWCYLGGPASASNNQVVNNSVSGSQYGISVAAYSFFSSCDAHADNNRIVNNDVIGSEDGEIGIFVGSAVITGSYDPKASGNKLIANSISGFDDGIVQDGDASTKVHANVIN